MEPSSPIRFSPPWKAPIHAVSTSRRKASHQASGGSIPMARSIPPPVRGRGVHAVRSDRDTTGLMLEDQLRVETSLDVQSAKRPRHQRRGTGLRYRGPWHLPGPDSHRLASVSLSLGYAS
jgi:hypothetical protein